MRPTILLATTALALLMFTAAANAATITISGIPSVVAVNDTFTVTVTGDFSDFTCSSCIVQLNFSTLLGTAGVLDVVGGASTSPSIFGWEFTPGSFFGGLDLVPGFVPNNNLDPQIVRSGAWLGLTPGGHLNGDWAPVLATVTFQAIGTGSTTVTPDFAPGDLFQTDVGDESGSVSFLGGGTVTVPEPSMAGLSIAVLGTLYGIRRIRRG